MCRITTLVPKRNVVVSNLDLTVPIFVLLENGSIMKDGIGISIIADNSVSTYKKAVQSNEYFWGKESVAFDFLSKNYTGKEIIVSHTRLATAGKGFKKDDNSHPFETNTLVGVHNGHFSNYQKIISECKFDSCEVDSDAFYRYLTNLVKADDGNAYRSIELKDIQDALDKLEGSFALSFYDKVSKKVWLITGSNDLYLVETNKYYLVNTSSVKDDINAYIKYANFIGSDLSFIKEEKLSSYKAYNLTPDGLIEVGSIKEAYYHNEWYRSSNQSPNNDNHLTVIETNNLRTFISDYSKLRKVSGLYNLGLCDLLLLLPNMPGNTIYLNHEQFCLLIDFINDLTSKNLWNSEEMARKSAIWRKFYIAHEDETKDAREKNEDFIVPYFLNDITLLESLNAVG